MIKSKIKTRFFLSYFTTFIMVITIVTVASYAIYFRLLISSELKIQESITAKMLESVESQLEAIPRTAAQYSLSPWVNRLAYIQKNPEIFNNGPLSYDIYEYSRQIQLTESNNNFGERLMIYYSLGGFGIADAGKISWTDFKGLNLFYSQNGDLMNGTILHKNHQQTIITDCKMKINGQIEDGFVYLQTIPFQDSVRGNVNILFFIPTNSIARFMSAYFHFSQISMSLIDYNDHVIPLNQFTTKMGSDEVRDIIEWYGDEQEYRFNKDLQEYIMYKELPMTNLRIMIGIPKRIIYMNVENIKWIFITTYLATIIFIVLLSFRMSTANYRPIKKIVNNISPMLDNFQLQGDSLHNEYSLIETGIQYLSDQKEKLSSIVFEQNPIIQRFLLTKLLNNQLKINPNSKYVEQLYAMTKYEYFNCLVLQKDGDYEQYKEDIIKCFDTVSELWCIDVDFTNSIVFVVNYRSKNIFSDICEWISQVFTDLNSNNPVIGIGQEKRDIFELPQIYRDAREAHKYRFIYYSRKVIYYVDIQDHENNEANQKSEDLRQLEEYLKLAQYENMFDLYAKILSENIWEHNISIDELYSLIDRINSRLTSLANQYVSNIPFDFLVNPRNFNSLTSYLEAVRLKFEKVCDYVNLSNERLTGINKQIIDYINHNLTDYNMSQKRVAEFFGYTPSYFSRYFKEQFNCNYYEYVLKQKVELAIQYLSEHKYTINEIAEMSGFANDATFRRVFKRYMGIAPTQYVNKDEKDE